MRPKKRAKLPAKRKVSDRKRRFAELYPITLNAAEACRQAGYSELFARKKSSQLLHDPDVQALIQEQIEARSRRTQVTQDMVIEELRRIGFSDIRNLFSWSEEQACFVPSRDLTEEQAAAVKAIESETVQIDTEDGPPIRKIKLKLTTYDKLGALVNLGKHLGMFNEKVEHAGTVQHTLNVRVVKE